MPKISLPPLPLSGLFAIAKPSGPTSMSVINDVKQLVCNSRLFVEASKLEEKRRTPKRGRRAREVVKIGQGGTLDPLADGVLVVGVGKGTKKLGDFLDCIKEYKTTVLLGCETDTYDSEGVRVRVAPWRHVTKEAVEEQLVNFRGEIYQTPPIFSALKMDGKPLYEYARKGIPLPRPIEKRKVTVHSLTLTDWKGPNHEFTWPEKQFTDKEREAMEKALRSVQEDVVIRNDPEPTSEPKDGLEPERETTLGDGLDRASEEEQAQKQTQTPSAFVLTMRVSGGTYVRSIVHDLGHALGSAAHVVTLTRSRQSRFALSPDEEADGAKGCIAWEVFTKAAEDEGAEDADGLKEWERAVLDKFEIIDENGNKS
ncbi:hypothetical protein SERLADRAFT_445537 [Serpula lacrymans var. lacrymans S7.9]|uniref:tRNA pseudouridine(55) synthase n=1 Tax=Serpula lacrymans var. lacrymans (strain S7.9) TaxID=578457 RepID=F8NI20_SERL9|nr:uncharacterized protein SERLADRAFT_445537 [Serpula lacrymans var. lacrymans S7.9]EGO29742.1 hypothetical protein SERLADRAFT_445537 [Serpula lacrymans var. lacrymans S7.9]